MPLPAPASRIPHEHLLLRVQGAGGTAAQGDAGTERQVVPPGSERTEGAFGILGMMISGLIIIFAIVLLFMRARRRK